MMFVNRSANTAGNDAAFDDIKVTDVTPQAYKSFGAASMPNHGTTPLTFYFVNTTALSAIANMTLTDVLPTGMTPVGAPVRQFARPQRAISRAQAPSRRPSLARPSTSRGTWQRAPAHAGSPSM